MLRARMQRFEHALREKGLKSTAQRDDIAKTFFSADTHYSVEELYNAVRRVNPRVGYATVYRTLKLLKECGLAAERHFDDGQARYEPTEETAQHHDHIICERCGKIVEFNSEELERQQERIARFLGFVVSHHRMELYGICSDCREGRRAAAKPARRRGIQRV
jgi:Fur family transcriptional regulator, ferric uptake regulator